MLNYSTHALESFQEVDFSCIHPEDAAGFQATIALLTKAVKFNLPENGSLFGDDFHKGYDIIDHTLLHLPFPIVALEYPFTYFIGADLGNFHSPKRLALAFDYHAMSTTYLAKHALKFYPDLQEVGGIVLLVLCEAYGRWILQPFGVTIPRVASSGTLSSFTYGKDNKMAQVGFMPFPVLPDSSRRLIDMLGPDLAISNGVKDAGEEITALVSLLAALSCSNVKMHTEPVPEKLNLKRAKNKKLPFYEYKVLKVETKTTKGVASNTGLTITGRQSPREHLRRGHIRRISESRRVWVQQAIIGSGKKGSFEKSFQL